jgi:hypothetical protein
MKLSFDEDNSCHGMNKYRNPNINLLKWLIAIGILGTIGWFTYGEIMKDQACPNGHCSKNGRFQCE